MNTILITGCSSGFGLETARYFHERDWNVIATMRTPREDILPTDDRLRVLPLDVTDPQSIAQVVKVVGPIDVLVNNAGIGWLNALEGSPIETIRDIFETNTFGTMTMMQAVLPQFRERKAGVIVNVTSTVTWMPLPLLSVYTASKAAVNAFSESVAIELRPFNVRVNVVLPGRAPETRFADNAMGRMNGFPEVYQELAQSTMEGWEEDTSELTKSIDVAEAIWRAVTDPTTPFFGPAGADAVALGNSS
ncbi:MAG: SDR family oxidoreductase [Hyphomonas sp.]|jgi:NAD(P)-dependent dehydrogenase (short-subunit alcohol dehydrogenase family)|uniref:SDR family oxidoreductase n=1 Tax=Hyphomonas sp. TaxID=87 RepID=UPI003266E3C3